MAMAMAMAMEQRGEAMSVDDLLPPEIWRQILTKLPVKSILRCRSVCKTWYSLIASPDFITNHAAQTLNHSTTNRVIVRHSIANNYPCVRHISFYNESFVESHETDGVPEDLWSGGDRIVGSCNGLVCIFIEDEERDEELNDFEVHSFMIWNPSIRKFVMLPFRHLPPEYDPKDRAAIRYLLGFGFDSDSGDYKVLRVGCFNSGPKSGVPVVSEIFDGRMGDWRAITPPVAPFNVGCPESCVYLHGSLHWIGCEYQGNCVLVSFNLSSEVSQKMVMPDGIVFKYYHNYSVLVNNGLLSMAVLTEQLRGDYIQYGDYFQYYCTVWSMKEYGVTESWTKLFNIELPYGLNHLGLVRIWENGELVIAKYGDNCVLVVYNPQNRTSKALLSANPYIYDLCFYKESLVLP